MLRVETAPTMPHMGDFLWTGHRASRRSADVMKTISKFHHLIWCLYEIYQQTQTNLNFSIRIASHMKPDDTDWELLATLQRDASPSNQALAEQVRISPPTALRRVRRLHEEGLIERQVALLDEDRIAALQGHGLTAIVEVTLDRQGAEHLEAFERRAVQDDAVRQCYRVAPGPDFVLVVRVPDMPAYQALAERLFTQDANVRNVRSFFSVKRAKFETRVPLARG